MAARGRPDMPTRQEKLFVRNTFINMQESPSPSPRRKWIGARPTSCPPVGYGDPDFVHEVEPAFSPAPLGLVPESSFIATPDVSPMRRGAYSAWGRAVGGSAMQGVDAHDPNATFDPFNPRVLQPAPGHSPTRRLQARQAYLGPGPSPRISLEEKPAPKHLWATPSLSSIFSSSRGEGKSAGSGRHASTILDSGDGYNSIAPDGASSAPCWVPPLPAGLEQKEEFSPAPPQGEARLRDSTGGTCGTTSSSPSKRHQQVLDTPPTDEEVAQFLRQWSLDKRCERALRGLPTSQQHEVMVGFNPAENAKNPSAKFLLWLSPRLQQVEGREPVTPEELQEFGDRWGLDERSRRIMEELPPVVQCQILTSFDPPPGTENVDAKLLSFARLQVYRAAARGRRGGRGQQLPHQPPATRSGRGPAPTPQGPRSGVVSSPTGSTFAGAAAFPGYVMGGPEPHQQHQESLHQFPMMHGTAPVPPPLPPHLRGEMPRPPAASGLPTPSLGLAPPPGKLDFPMRAAGPPPDLKEMDPFACEKVRMQSPYSVQALPREVPMAVPKSPLASPSVRPPLIGWAQLEAAINDFVAQWGLDAQAEQALRSLPALQQQTIMDGFRPSKKTANMNRKFIAYTRMILQNAQQPRYVQASVPVNSSVSDVLVWA